MSWVVTLEIEGQTWKPIAVFQDEEPAQAYVEAMEDRAPIGNNYLYWEVDDLTDEDVPLPEEMSDEEYRAERDAMRADDAWAERGL